MNKEYVIYTIQELKLFIKLRINEEQAKIEHRENIYIRMEYRLKLIFIKMKTDDNEPTMREIVNKGFKRKRPLDQYNLSTTSIT